MNHFRSLCTVLALSVTCIPTLAQADGFMPGNLAVLRIAPPTVGGVASDAASPVFIEQFSKTATGQTVSAATTKVALPTVATTTGNRSLTLSGLSASNGGLTRSTNYYSLVLGGYNATVGGSKAGDLDVGHAASVDVNRVIGAINAKLQVNTTTALKSAYDGDNFRNVASTNGVDFWTAGNQAFDSATHGTRYAQLGAPLQSNGLDSIKLAGDPGNTNRVEIFDGQVYAAIRSPGGGAQRGIYMIGTDHLEALPITESLDGNQLVDISTDPASTTPYDFFMADLNPSINSHRADGTVTGIDTAYLADSTVGIRKYTFNGTTWTQSYALSVPGGVTGLTAEVVGGVTKLYGITGLGITGNSLISITDTGAGSKATVLATAPANNAFRGVALTPYLPGDATLDGKVDGADYTKWADHYLQTAGFENGDFTGDHKVDGADYTLWADNYLVSVQPGGPALAMAVPEPATWGLLITGAGLLVLFRKRLTK